MHAHYDNCNTDIHLFRIVISFCRVSVFYLLQIHARMCIHLCIIELHKRKQTFFKAKIFIALCDS